MSDFFWFSCILSLIIVGCDNSKEDPTPPLIEVPIIADFNPKSGATGTAVTITGENFSATPNNNEILFGGVSAEVISSSHTSIETTVPQGAQTGSIRITVNGLSGTSMENFEVLKPFWVQKADFGGIGRIRSTGFSIGNKGYIILGNSISQNAGRETDLWEYNPETDEWIQKSDFPSLGREYAISFTIGDKAYVGLGFSNDGDNNDLWEYDQELDQWSQKADFPGLPREAAVAFSIAGKGYVGLGTNLFFSASYKDVWEYDPRNDSWSLLGNYPGSGRKCWIRY